MPSLEGSDLETDDGEDFEHLPSDDDTDHGSVPMVSIVAWGFGIPAGRSGKLSIIPATDISFDQCPGDFPNRMLIVCHGKQTEQSLQASYENQLKSFGKF